jgi:ribose/xylose/arabinose/galactoside ABC-type transport system permease subunit
MNEILVAAGFGIIGALVRVLVTSLKTVQLKQKISFAGFGVYALVVLSIGAFSGIILSYGKVLSFLAGYAGLDLIEGYYKVFKKKRIKFK